MLKQAECGSFRIWIKTRSKYVATFGKYLRNVFQVKVNKKNLPKKSV